MAGEGAAGDFAALQAEIGKLGVAQVVHAGDFAGDFAAGAKIADEAGQKIEGHVRFPQVAGKSASPVSFAVDLVFPGGFTTYKFALQHFQTGGAG
jgi:hypothetical protein